MNKFKQEGEERYALIVIDALSRYVYIDPMENKNSEDALKALKEAFKVMGEPIEIFSDEDTAFLSVVKKYLDGLGIVQKTTRTHANIVGRLIRAIKNGVANRIRFTKGNWIDLYKPTLRKYNSTIRSSTGAKPVEAHKDENRVNVKVNLTLKQFFSSQAAADLGDTGSPELKEKRLRNAPETSCLQSKV